MTAIDNLYLEIENEANLLHDKLLNKFLNRIINNEYKDNYKRYLLNQYIDIRHQRHKLYKHYVESGISKENIEIVLIDMDQLILKYKQTILPYMSYNA